MQDTPAYALPRNGLGIALMLGCGVALVLQDVFTKLLTQKYPIGEVIYYRSLFSFIVIAAVVWHAGGIASLGVRNWRGLLLRTVVAVAAMWFIVTSFWLLPIADVVIILFMGPIFTTALATPLLGEQVGLRRWAAVGVGFVGALIMIRPTGFQFQTLLLIPLGTALATALRDIVTRKVTATDSSTAILFYSMVGVTLSGLLSMPFQWRAYDWADTHMFLAAGLLGGMAHYLMIQSFRYAEVSVVSPFKYVNVIWAIILGYLVFGDLPAAHMVAGAVLVVVAGLYILHRETRAKKN